MKSDNNKSLKKNILITIIPQKSCPNPGSSICGLLKIQDQSALHDHLHTILHPDRQNFLHDHRKSADSKALPEMESRSIMDALCLLHLTVESISFIIGVKLQKSIRSIFQPAEPSQCIMRGLPCPQEIWPPRLAP